MEVKRIASGSNITMRREIAKVQRLIEQYRDAGRYTEAIALLRKALTVNAYDLDAQLLLAELLSANGPSDEAREIATRVFVAIETEMLLPRIEAVAPSIRVCIETNHAWNAADAPPDGPRVTLIPVGQEPDMVFREFGRRLNQFLRIPVEISVIRMPLHSPERDPGGRWLNRTYQSMMYPLSLQRQALLGMNFELTPTLLSSRSQKVAAIETYYQLRGAAGTNALSKFKATLATYDSRAQYNADRLIADVRKAYPAHPNELVLIVSSGDIFSGTANFVFCTPIPPYACMSNARYLSAYWGGTEYRPRLIARMLKGAVWGVFANAGLPVCTTPFCMRAYVHNLEELDHNENSLCDSCRKLWADYSGHALEP